MRPVLFAMCLGALVLGACGSADRPTPSQTPSTAFATPAVPPPPDGTTAEVILVWDGDSMRVEIDGTVDEVRLVGINAPEQDECYGEAARQTLIDLVGGRSVTLLSAGGDERDRFGRLLFYVAVDDLTVNESMVESGNALALQGGHPLEATYTTLGDTAHEAGRGMWAADACGTRATDEIRIADIFYDAPGNDGENPSGEWVLVENTGTAPTDLSGWILRDESSSHRFTFPEGLVLGEGDAVRIVSGCYPAETGVLAWCAGGAVWNNAGDTAILQTPEGTVVDRVRY